MVVFIKYTGYWVVSIFVVGLASQIVAVSVSQRVGCDVEMLQQAENVVQAFVDEVGTTLIEYPLSGICCDEESYATPVVDMSALSEALVRTHHRIGVDLHVGGIFPYRGESRFRRIRAIDYFVANAVGNLDINSLVVLFK